MASIRSRIGLAVLSALAASDLSRHENALVIRPPEPDPGWEAARERRREAKAAAEQRRLEIEKLNAGRPLTRQQRRRIERPWKYPRFHQKRKDA